MPNSSTLRSEMAPDLSGIRHTCLIPTPSCSSLLLPPTFSPLLFFFFVRVHFKTNPTCSALISTIAGSGFANSAEIMGCWKTKGRQFKGFKMCWRATRKLAWVKRIFPPCGTFFLNFLWEAGLGYEAQAGSVFSGSVNFPEQHISEGGKTQFNSNWIEHYVPTQ